MQNQQWTNCFHFFMVAQSVIFVIIIIIIISNNPNLTFFFPPYWMSMTFADWMQCICWFIYVVLSFILCPFCSFFFVARSIHSGTFTTNSLPCVVLSAEKEVSCPLEKSIQQNKTRQEQTYQNKTKPDKSKHTKTEREVLPLWFLGDQGFINWFNHKKYFQLFFWKWNNLFLLI